MKRFLNILFVNILILIFLLVLIEIITRIFLNFYIGNSTAGLKERQANLIYQPFVMYGINWDKKMYLKKNKGGKNCTEGFSYNSKQNENFLTVNQLKKIIKNILQ